jgi:hypothetical protein
MFILEKKRGIEAADISNRIVAIPEEGIRGLFSFLRIVEPKVIASAATPIIRRTS